MDSAIRCLLTGLAQAGEFVTPDGFAPDQYDEATAERAIAAGLARLDAGSGWDTATRLSLTRAGRVALGLPVTPRLIDRVRAWLARPAHG